jgi:hypothetical protein
MAASGLQLRMNLLPLNATAYQPVSREQRARRAGRRRHRRAPARAQCRFEEQQLRQVHALPQFVRDLQRFLELGLRGIGVAVGATARRPPERWVLAPIRRTSAGIRALERHLHMKRGYR